MAIIDSLLEKGILVSPEVLEDPDLMKLLAKLDIETLSGVDMIDGEFLTSDKKPVQTQNHYEVLFSYNKKPGKINIGDFISYFNRRFEGISNIIRQRPEFQGTVSISRLKAKKEKEQVTCIGMVYEKTVTKKNTLILTLEDPTGTIVVMIKPDKKELYDLANELVHDEIIGVEGTVSNGYIFPNHIYFPDIPAIKELKKSTEEEYVAFIGDLHFGAKVFLDEEYADFLEWINGRKGSPEQREIASKVKYLVFIGDLIEGVGIYPGQEQDLVVEDVYDQCKLFTESLKQIPSHITCFICPGNHDPGRLSEPQLPVSYKYFEDLKNFPNAVLVSNPALIRLGIKKNFPGFDMLMYHGYSMVYYANNINSIRSNGGQKRPDLIMKFMLQRRHLAPTHTSNLYIPDIAEDPLIIKHIPDIFVTGHIHRLSVGQYKNITLINSSCWNDITESQEKRGLEPQPGKLPVMNLKTREVKIINFMKNEKKTPPPDKEATEKTEEPVKITLPSKEPATA
jgi:DNA polymerase II small subunit